jgi:hypothetical protein
VKIKGKSKKKHGGMFWWKDIGEYKMMGHL